MEIRARLQSHDENDQGKGQQLKSNQIPHRRSTKPYLALIPHVLYFNITQKTLRLLYTLNCFVSCLTARGACPVEYLNKYISGHIHVHMLIPEFSSTPSGHLGVIRRLSSAPCILKYSYIYDCTSSVTFCSMALSSSPFSGNFFSFPKSRAPC
jgi:hypothetical protein